MVRLRRSRDDVRRQLLWIASSAAFLAVGVVVILAVPRLQGEEGTWLAGLPLRLAQLSVPLCVAVAVLRHRLLEIDLIVNRAVMLRPGHRRWRPVGTCSSSWRRAAPSAPAASGPRCWPPPWSPWPSSRCANAWSESPTAWPSAPRRRPTRPSPTSAAGSARALTPWPCCPAVADAAAHAVSARRAVVVLHVEAGPDLTARWPASDQAPPTASTVDIPVVDRGEQLGVITIEMPPGRPLRPRDHRLLADLADQAGMAFRHARLTAELSGQVEQLRSHTHRLAESRRRLITAGDAERSRLERAIARQVMLHLTPLPDRLGQLSRVEPDGTTALDPPMILPLLQSLSISLEALREITRGVFPAQLGALRARPRHWSLCSHGVAAPDT